VCFIESGGNIFALSRANCAGIAQFSVGTAIACGLYVDENWRHYYNDWKNAKTPAKKAEKAAILMRMDERFDPTKAIPAMAFHLDTLRRNLGGMDRAIAAYHMGGPRFNYATAVYEAGADEPEFTRWSKLVHDTDAKRRPFLYRFLYKTLKDDSVNYYYKCKAAYFAARLWELDRPAFSAKDEFYHSPAAKKSGYMLCGNLNVMYYLPASKLTLSQRFGEMIFSLWLWIPTFLLQLFAVIAWRKIFSRR